MHTPRISHREQRRDTQRSQLLPHDAPPTHTHTQTHSHTDDARTGFEVLKHQRWRTPLSPAPDPKTQLRASFILANFALTSTHTHHGPAPNE